MGTLSTIPTQEDSLEHEGENLSLSSFRSTTSTETDNVFIETARKQEIRDEIASLLEIQVEEILA